MFMAIKAAVPDASWPEFLDAMRMINEQDMRKIIGEEMEQAEQLERRLHDDQQS